MNSYIKLTEDNRSRIYIWDTRYSVKELTLENLKLRNK